MQSITRRGFAIAAGLALAPAGTRAQGVTATEIKLGQTMPYSGPASAYGAVGRAEVAYFAMVNAQGGVNGRKVTVLSLDDGYAPPKTVEATRRLVEEEQVLAMFAPLGTAGLSQYLTSSSCTTATTPLFKYVDWLTAPKAAPGSVGTPTRR